MQSEEGTNLMANTYNGLNLALKSFSNLHRLCQFFAKCLILMDVES